MSALAERPATASSSTSVTVLGQTETDDLLVEEPMDFDVLGPILINVPEEPDEVYPEGSGPFGV